MVNTTTDFIGWLDHVDPGDGDGYEDVYCLYRATIDCEEWGCYTCVTTKNGKGWIVTEAGYEVGLLLASEKARNHFLDQLTRVHCGDLDMEGWYLYHHAMSKND